MPDKIENAFLTCLKEIEVRYTVLPKSLRLRYMLPIVGYCLLIFRIRVERWIEKLVIVGKNDVWKKDRNLYARLLLSMVLARSLSDPFDVTPPEGPLPPFPSYLRPKLKNVAGPHESFFWRDVYDRLQPSAADETITSPKPFLDFSSTIRLDPDKKETYNLRQLIAEQARRIEILEQQLNEERMHHEEEIQRFLQHHKSEIARLREAYKRKGHAIDHTHSIHQREHMNRSYDSFMLSRHDLTKTPRPSSVEVPKGSENVLRRSFDTTRRSPVLIPPSHPPMPLGSSPETFPPSHHEKKEDNDSNLWMSRTGDKSIAHDNSPPETNKDTSRLTTLTPALNTTQRTSQTDITPSIAGMSTSTDVHPTKMLHRGDMASAITSGSHHPPSSAQFDIHPRPSPPVDRYELDDSYDVRDNTTTQVSNSVVGEGTVSKKEEEDIFSRSIPDDDNEFMSYLEDFQSQIRTLQFNIPRVP